jgi:hypothetical protein
MLCDPRSMCEEDPPSTSVLVDVVTVLGGDIITNGSPPVDEPELAERLIAAAALFDIAGRILRDATDRAVRGGVDVNWIPSLMADAANSAGSVSVTPPPRRPHLVVPDRR